MAWTAATACAPPPPDSQQDGTGGGAQPQGDDDPHALQARPLPHLSAADGEPAAELTALGRVVKKAAPDYFQACDSTFLAKQEANREAFEQKMMKELEVDKNPLFPVLDKIPSLFGSKSTAST
eukprot:CAMPEP_0177764238 /NCGR_PEP_ID=MMETSP0491_2-20121128/7295_1 /TAXON_ID=63592 /ORGANISM="Tetraselmis chuii, Strain PLY429" /LENGTH=122 /DNA_ID=CAMNT_0019280393 /DNA_START=609 /DNA_END=979 /DNA_ORIENTATION=-